MLITTSLKPKRREGVHSQNLPDGSSLLFDPDSATAYPISESAARIWALSDGGHTVGEIVDELESQYEVDRETLDADSLKLIEDLVEKKILEL